jgi:hypothetical protein
MIGCWVALPFHRKLCWVATLTTLAGALCTSLRIDPLNVYILNVGAVLFLWWAIIIKDRAMVAVNTGLLAIYVVGLFFSQ